MKIEADYIFKTASNAEWQKWLNQWKHEYTVEIMHIKLDKDESTILIKRWVKHE